jgi:hypothetical protein
MTHFEKLVLTVTLSYLHPDMTIELRHVALWTTAFLISAAGGLNWALLTSSHIKNIAPKA